jgi:hypothetical protein
MVQEKTSFISEIIKFIASLLEGNHREKTPKTVRHAPSPSAPKPAQQPKGEPASANGKQTGTVIASLLNMREMPGGDVVEKLPKNTTVTILGSDNGWLHISADGKTGYVSEKYIDSGESLPAKAEPKKEETAHTVEATPAILMNDDESNFKYENDRAFAPDGTMFGKKLKLGLYNYGETSMAEFIDSNKNRFSSISESLVNVMKSVSENEGNYEAINTWDNAFLSFGIFQWTCGAASDKGELPALMEKLSNSYPDVYERYFGRFGLGTDQVRNPSGYPGTGYFKLNGDILNKPEKKSYLRTLHWAYRFWLAGQNNDVREVQTLHAASRIECFYHEEKKMVGSFFVSDFATSEYFAALLLDQHVNRPGHVPKILAHSVAALDGVIDINNPSGWGDDEEKILINKYLELRADTSMTHSQRRAETVYKRVKDGTISDKRGSFKLA